MPNATASADGAVAANPSRRTELLVLVALGLLTHARSLGGDFHYDDLHSIVGNHHIRSLALIPALFTDPTTFSGLSFGGMFRPLVMVTYTLTYVLVGLSAGAFLLTNLILHICATLMVRAILCRFFQQRLYALVPAALFAVHPVNVETVAYVSSRSESMCALFMFLTLWFYGRTNRLSQVLAVLSFAAALACKSVGIVLVPLLVLYEFWFVAKDAKGRFLALIPYSIVTIGYLGIVQGLLATSLLQAPVRSMQLQLLTQAKALVYYLHLLSVPWPLSVEHQFQPGRLTDPSVWLAALLLVTLAVIFVRSSADRPLRWWLLWGGAVLLPTLIIPLNVLVNEHRLYMVTAVFAILMTHLIVPSSGKVHRLTVMVIVVFAVLAFQRSAVWADSHTLWQDALTKGPQMPRPYLFVGDAEASAGRYGTALVLYQQALDVNPRQLSGADRLVIHNNRGAALLALGAFSEAREAYASALKIDPAYAPSRDALEALSAFAGGGDEKLALAARRSGLSAMVAGDISAAIHYLRQSLAVISDTGTWLALARCHERLGQTEQALGIYRLLSLSGDADVARVAVQRLDPTAARQEARSE